MTTDWPREREVFTRATQRWLGVPDDGKPGPVTWTAWEHETGDSRPGAVVADPTLPAEGWPGPDQRSLEAFYGPPGSGQTYVTLPYPMRLAWDPDTRVTRARCHERVAASLAGILEAVRDEYGSLAALQEHGLDLFGGIYNLRKMRDRDLWSVHSWGAAIDLDPVHNGLRTSWPQDARMPERVFELFEAEGWTCLGRVIGRDAMHMQATTWG